MKESENGTGEVRSLRGQNEEGHHRFLRLGLFQRVVETGQRFYEHVSALVAEFVATDEEKVLGPCQVEVYLPLEMFAD